MNLLLKIILVMLCSGVSYSSPEKTSGSDVLSTEKPPAVVSGSSPDHNKTAKPLLVSSGSTAMPTTQTLQPVTSVISSTANSLINETVTAENKYKAPVIIEGKNASVSAKNASAENSTSSVTPKQNNIISTKTTVQPVNDTNLNQSITVTTTPAISTTTAATLVSAADHAKPSPNPQERQFDGPSFVGGIVLTIGLTVIGFIAFKFYKSGKIERNYRTL